MLTGEGALPFCGADGDPRWTPLACVDGVLTSSPTEPGAISQCDLASGSKPCVPAKMWVQASCRLPPALAPRDLEYAACPYVKKPHYLCPKAQRDELARSVQGAGTAAATAACRASTRFCTTARLRAPLAAAPSASSATRR